MKKYMVLFFVVLLVIVMMAMPAYAGGGRHHGYGGHYYGHGYYGYGLGERIVDAIFGPPAVVYVTRPVCTRQLVLIGYDRCGRPVYQRMKVCN
jgi:hypothetical protein